MLSFDHIDPNSFALLAALLGILVTLGLDANEQNALGNFFLSFGQTMLTKAAQFENLKDHSETNNISNQIDDISRQLEDLKKQFKNH